MPDIRSDLAGLIALIIECILYGIYLISLSKCISIWLIPRAAYIQKPRFPPVLGTMTVCLAVFATLDVSFSIYAAIVAFVKYRGPGGPLAVYMDISSWVSVSKVSLFISLNAEYRPRNLTKIPLLHRSASNSLWLYSWTRFS